MPVAWNRERSASPAWPFEEGEDSGVAGWAVAGRWHCPASSWEVLRGCPAGSVIAGEGFPQPWKRLVSSAWQGGAADPPAGDPPHHPAAPASAPSSHQGPAAGARVWAGTEPRPLTLLRVPVASSCLASQHWLKADMSNRVPKTQAVPCSPRWASATKVRQGGPWGSELSDRWLPCSQPCCSGWLQPAPYRPGWESGALATESHRLLSIPPSCFPRFLATSPAIPSRPAQIHSLCEPHPSPLQGAKNPEEALTALQGAGVARCSRRGGAGEHKDSPSSV